MTRMVWAGDQLLWELRARAQPTDDLEAESTSGDFYGVVSYTHATGIDRPLAIHKGGQPVIIPHENWRGQFARGTDLQGRVIDCPEGGAPTPACIRLAWPGHRTTAWHLEARAPDVVSWYGGLVDGMRDASGQMYMRNRYYDPATGQFTQPDPIGLAGGLNSYGFAAGDPVSYNDPSGLCAADLVDHDSRRCPGGLTHTEWDLREDGFQELTPNDNSIASTCKGIPSCRAGVDWAEDQERTTVRETIRRRLLTDGFCGEIRRSAFEMVDRGLAIIPDGVGIVGEAPFAYPPYPRPGRLMFLGRSQLRNGHAIAHEALHGVMKNPLDGYVHGDMTPLGVRFEAAALACSRGGT